MEVIKMASQDLYNELKQINALDIQTISSDTTTNGDIIDTAGYESVTFIFQTGTVTDGDYTVLIQDGDDSGLSDAAAVTDANLLGTESGASFTADTDDNKTSKIGYKGVKRYVRFNIVSTNTSSGAVLGAVAILGHARTQPQDTQVV